MDDIARWFGSESSLRQCLQGFSPRPEQLEMGQAVAGALEVGEHLVVEAGTGTGKTLAYLIPVLLSGQRVIISTGTKTLQDQLYHRDLPMATAALGRPVTIVQLKGRSNYLCLHRLEALRQDSAGGKTPIDPQAFQQIEAWSRLTRSGDIAEVDTVSEDADIWPQVTSTVENCLGSKCELYDKCHVVGARQAAMGADVVVVNHHLLLADLVLKEEGFGELLPGFDAVVIDEAHQFPDIAQGFFNVSMSMNRIQELLQDLRAEASAAALPALGMDDYVAAVTKAVRDTRLDLPAEEGNVAWSGFEAQLGADLEELTIRLQSLADRLSDVDDLSAGLQRVRDRLISTIETLEDLSGADESAGLKWIRLTRLGFSLNYTPIDVANNLRELMEAQSCTWIFTSATLAIGDDFSHFLARMGMPGETRTLLIPSSFDYASVAMLYLPPGLSDPGAPDYTDQVVATIKPLIYDTNGRAFLLFTSHRALRRAAELFERDPEFDFPVLTQGSAPRSRLLEQFVALSNPVLVGTTSFWEGVDIRGDSLIMVVIDKLPFASPSDPILQARLEGIKKAGGNPFKDFQLPQAVLALKQGVGRLIRDREDYGVIVICDPRLRRRSYGKLFLSSLPPMPVTDEISDVSEFLGARQGVP